MVDVKWWRGGVVGYDGPELLRDLCTASALFAASDGLGGHRWWSGLSGCVADGAALLRALVAATALGSTTRWIVSHRRRRGAMVVARQVSGHADWPTGGPAFETANEICVPVNQPVEFRLRSHDVIHAFWIPAFAGKVDMIPGRTTRLTVHPFRMGRYRGACAEYCGESHALMNFDVRVVSSSEFEKWLIHQASPASGPADSSTIQAEDPAAVASPAAVTSAQSQPGHALFLATGCGACHTVRGTPAQGSVGPDLTHFGSRLSLGAGIFPVDHTLYRRLASLDGASQAGGPHAHFWRSATRAARTTSDFLEQLK